jgi:hypothetical protein
MFEITIEITSLVCYNLLYVVHNMLRLKTFLSIPEDEGAWVVQSVQRLGGWQDDVEMGKEAFRTSTVSKTGSGYPHPDSSSSGYCGLRG